MKKYSDCYKYVVVTRCIDILRHDIAESLLKVALKHQINYLKRYFDCYKYVMMTPWKDILLATSMWWWPYGKIFWWPQVCGGDSMERYVDS